MSVNSSHTILSCYQNGHLVVRFWYLETESCHEKLDQYCEREKLKDYLLKKKNSFRESIVRNYLSGW